MSSLYGAYIKERENKSIIESEKGFATYFFIEGGVYIEQLYVAPDHRHGHVASDMADQIAHIAKAKGYKHMYGTVKPSTNFSTDSLKVLLAYGFKLDGAANDAIVMKKEL